jgi:hypothetical protein
MRLSQEAEIRELLPVSGGRTKSANMGARSSIWHDCNWSFTIPIGLLLIIGTVNFGLNVATLVAVNDKNTSTTGPNMLYGVDAKSATMKPTSGGCEITIDTTGDETQLQLYQFVDRPYRGMSKVLTPTDFAKLWDPKSEGNSFHDDPPKTAVKQGGKIGFNTVEITAVTYATSKLTLTLRRPTASWGGLNPEEFCKITTPTPSPLNLFVDSLMSCRETGVGC